MKELLQDPVCGMQITAVSPYHTVHGGAMFQFCSEACRTCFLAAPLDFIDIRALKREVPVAVPLAEDVIEESVLPIAGDRRARNFGQKLEHLLGGWLLGLIASMVIALREGRYAARTSRELLTLFRAVSIKHPELAGRELYRLLVIARTGCDIAAADVTLECAEMSFATWPVRRELTLCDVVRYLTVSEFVSLRDSENWMHSDVQHAVVSRIPHDLCIYRKRQ
jgi:YHS domain-containing protein